MMRLCARHSNFVSNLIIYRKSTKELRKIQCFSKPRSRRYATIVSPEYIKKNLKLSDDHITPELKLHLLTRENPLYFAPAEDSVLQDPWWAVYWPGGQVLSRYFLDFPSVLSGRKVLDLGCGCGAVSLAAARAGALSVAANDIDPNSEIAVTVNSAVNKVGDISFISDDLITDRSSSSSNILQEIDVLCVGDMLYDEQIGSSLFSLCSSFLNLKPDNKIFIGDPGRWVLTENSLKVTEQFDCVARYELNYTGKQENHGFKHGFVWASK